MSSTSADVPESHPPADRPEGPRRRRPLQRTLDGIERAGNRLLHPATLFVILAAAYADQMNLAMDYRLIIASTVLLTIMGTLVSQFIVEPAAARRMER